MGNAPADGIGKTVFAITFITALLAPDAMPVVFVIGMVIGWIVLVIDGWARKGVDK